MRLGLSPAKFAVRTYPVLESGEIMIQNPVRDEVIGDLKFIAIFFAVAIPFMWWMA